MCPAHSCTASNAAPARCAALRAASTRIVVGAGATSTGQLPNRTAIALAAELGTPVVEFPGDHGGFLASPGPFADVLDQVLSHPA